MRWKILAATLGLLLVVTNLWHGYRAVDQAVTEAYRREVLFELANRVTANAKLADSCVAGKTKADAIALLSKAFPADEPFVKEGAIHTTWVALELSKEGRVARVEVEPDVAEWAQAR